MSDPYLRLGDKVALAMPQYITVDITERACAMVPAETPDAEAALCELLSRWLLDHDHMGYEPSLNMGYDLFSDSCVASILCFKRPL